MKTYRNLGGGRLFHAAFLGATLLLALPASADPTPTEVAMARRLFVQASELEAESKFAEARQKLNEAIAIKETPGIRFHLGYCAEQLGEYVSALVEYERALDLIRGGVKAPDVQRLAAPARERVQARVAQLTLRLPADARDASVELDGRRMAPALLGQAAPLDPGKHAVLVKAADGRHARLDLELAAGEARSVDVVLERDRAAAAPEQKFPSAAAPKSGAAVPARESAKPHSASASLDSGSAGGLGLREAVLIGEATVTLAALGVGIGYLIARGNARERAEQAQDDVDLLTQGDSSACSEGNTAVRASCDDLESAISDYDRAGLISTVGFVAAGVGAASAALTFALWPAQGSKTALRISPAASGLGLSASGRF